MRFDSRRHERFHHRLAAGLASLAWGVVAGSWGGSVPAEAGAWNQPAGQGLLLIDYTLSSGARYFNGAGQLSRAAAYRKQEASAYVEYGLTDRLTAIVRPSLAMISAAASADPGSATHHEAGLAGGEAALQWHLLAFGPAVVAVQAGFRLPGTTSHRNPADIGNTSRDADVRLLSGVAFDLGGWPAFLDAEGGFRFRSGGASAEWHADVTVGARIRPNLMILLQSFSTVSQGAGTAWFPASSSSKLETAAVYSLNERWSVELGVFQTVLGVDALRERGFQIAVWHRF